MQELFCTNVTFLCVEVEMNLFDQQDIQRPWWINECKLLWLIHIKNMLDVALLIHMERMFWKTFQNVLHAMPVCQDITCGLYFSEGDVTYCTVTAVWNPDQLSVWWFYCLFQVETLSRYINTSLILIRLWGNLYSWHTSQRSAGAFHSAAPTMWGLEGSSPPRNNSVGAEPPQKF